MYRQWLPQWVDLSPPAWPWFKNSPISSTPSIGLQAFVHKVLWGCIAPHSQVWCRSVAGDKVESKDLKIGVTCDCGVFVKLLKPCIIFTSVFVEPCKTKGMLIGNKKWHSGTKRKSLGSNKGYGFLCRERVLSSNL